jgi:hypothetical protein
MPDRVNDFLRQLISLGIRALGFVLHLSLLVRTLAFSRQQRRLQRRFGVDNQTPIRSFERETERLIESVGRSRGPKALWAITSGSTGKPKRLLYTNRRLRALKWIYIDAFTRMCCSLRIKRTSLYVFSSFTKDDSLTSLLLNDRRLPHFFTTLQAPYRVQCDATIKTLVNQYGSAAVRLWLLIVANPGVLYATNPSTLVAFLDEVKNDWLRVRQFTKDWSKSRADFPAQINLIARRLCSTGWQERIAQVANSDTPLELAQFAPAVATYMCWTGGYVQTFLSRLASHLPSPRYRLVPMYSMSTETIETIPCFESSRTSFLPLAPGVLYEFLAEDAADEPRNLLRPDQLVAGHAYTMVVSDAFGLKRYQTDDLFYCDGITHGLPSLSFLRRRSLQHSFTGEKLTAEQLSIVYKELDCSNAFFTCVPCIASSPHYRVFGVGGKVERDLSSEIDDRLAALNSEYKSKRLGGRLGKISFEEISLEEFLRRIPAAKDTWETQFKFLPLYLEPLNCEVGH